LNPRPVNRKSNALPLSHHPLACECSRLRQCSVSATKFIYYGNLTVASIDSTNVCVCVCLQPLPGYVADTPSLATTHVVTSDWRLGAGARRAWWPLIDLTSDACCSFAVLALRGRWSSSYRLSSLSRIAPRRAWMRLLLQMSHVAWSVCLSVWVFGTRVNCAKTAEPIEMPFGADSSHVGPKNHDGWGSQVPYGNGHFWGGHVPAHTHTYA